MVQREECDEHTKADTMENKQSYLFVTWEGGGNVPPVLGLAASLIKAGHSVRILAEPCLKEAVELIGAKYIAFKKHFIRTDRAVDMIQDWKAKALEIPSIDNILIKPAHDVALETQAALQESKTDVVVADFMMPGALIAAEAMHIKRVALFHMPEYLPGPGRPPGGMGLLPAHSLFGKARDALLAKVFHRIMNRYLAPLNQVRAAFALPPCQSLVEIYHSADLRLIQTCEAFDAPITPAPSNVRYIGPVLDDPSWADELRFEGYKEDARPLVIVSLSSTFQNQKDVLTRIIDAFTGLDAIGIVTLGPAMKDEEFEAPSNVHLISSAPHNQLFPLADAVVTHAGHGTVMRALSHGLPVVCLPMGRDQLDNASLVAHHGAGIRLKKNANSRKIAKAIEQILSQSYFRDGAQSLQTAILQDAEECRGVGYLENLAR